MWKGSFKPYPKEQDEVKQAEKNAKKKLIE